MIGPPTPVVAAAGRPAVRRSAADAVVVGAGVLGSAVAFGLARRGLGVAVVDGREGPGLGTTSASSSIVRFTYSTFVGTLMAWEAAGLWESFRDHLGAPADEPVARLVRTGMVLLDAPDVDAAAITHTLLRVGVPHERWDAARLVAEVPGLDPGRHHPPSLPEDDAFWAESTGTLGALWTPDAGVVDDPRLAAANLAAAAERAGATLHWRTTVTGLDRRRDTWTVTTTQGAVDAPVVVVAAGPWSRGLLELAGAAAGMLPTRPLRQEVHVLPDPPGYRRADGLGPVVSDPDLGYYLRPGLVEGVVVGSMEPECDPLEWVADPDAADPNRTEAAYSRQAMRVARRFPGLEVPPRPRGLASVYDVTPDWAPVYDRTDVPGLYAAHGTSGNQFKTAPLVGELLARLVVEVETGRDHDADPLVVPGVRTGLPIELSAFSRRRVVGSATTVVG